MAQKDYNLEMVLDLLKNRENHIRGMAKNLETSHTTILRKINELLRENILDYVWGGKNKVFRLKRNLPAKNCIYMAEHYKLRRLFEEYPSLRITLQDVLAEVPSGLAIIFGSYARFEAGKDSDIDLFIETNDAEVRKRISLIDKRINVKTGALDPSNKLATEIIKNHAIVRGVEEFYEKIRFFKDA